MVFYSSLPKPEAPLANTQKRGRKVSVVAHGRPSLPSNCMLAHATLRLSDSGRIAVESSVFGAVVAKFATSTASEVGGR